MTPIVVGVIVAAGASTRMGRPKQLLEIGGRPLLQWVVDAAEASKLDRIVVVTGHAAPEIRDAITLRRAVWAHNPDPEQGTMSSLRAGVDAAGDAAGIMKLVCDQPEIATEVIDALIDFWDPALFPASLVEYPDGDGHPMLLAADALAEVIAEDGDRRLWALVERHPAGTGRLIVDRMRPIDVNSPDDLEAAAARLGAELDR